MKTAKTRTAARLRGQFVVAWIRFRDRVWVNIREVPARQKPARAIPACSNTFRSLVNVSASRASRVLPVGGFRHQDLVELSAAAAIEPGAGGEGPRFPHHTCRDLESLSRRT